MSDSIYKITLGISLLSFVLALKNVNILDWHSILAILIMVKVVVSLCKLVEVGNN